MNQRIEDIKAREQAATPGPWNEKNWPRHHSCWIEGAWDGNAEADANTLFMLNSREDIPYLLSELDRLTAENERSKETATFIKDKLHSMPIGSNRLEIIRKEILEQLEDENK